MVSSEFWSGGRTLHSLIKFSHVLGANSLCKSMTMSPTLSSSSTNCQYTKFKGKYRSWWSAMQSRARRQMFGAESNSPPARFRIPLCRSKVVAFIKAVYMHHGTTSRFAFSTLLRDHHPERSPLGEDLVHVWLFGDSEWRRSLDLRDSE
jgi:hypothetical protein